MVSCGRSSQDNSLNRKVDSLENEIQELKRANDTLSAHLMKKAYATRNYPLYFDTIVEPEKFILKELQEEPVPKTAVLGGTMRFISVSFINDALLVAEFEDGHIMGKAIYSYAMDREGKLQFRHLENIE